MCNMSWCTGHLLLTKKDQDVRIRGRVHDTSTVFPISSLLLKRTIGRKNFGRYPSRSGSAIQDILSVRSNERLRAIPQRSPRSRPLPPRRSAAPDCAAAPRAHASPSPCLPLLALSPPPLASPVLPCSRSHHARALRRERIA